MMKLINAIAIMMFKSDRCGIETKTLYAILYLPKTGSNQTVAGLKRV